MVGIGLAVLALWALNGQRDELVGASNALSHLRIGWLMLAVALEVASFVCFGALQRRLLRCGGVNTSLASMTALSLAAGAIASSVPGGPAVSSVYAFRQYRRRGADEALAGWTLLATLVCAALALGLLATAGVLIAEQQGSAYGLVGVIIGVLAVTVLADAVVWQRRWLARVATALLELSRRIFKRPRREAVEIVEELLARLAEVRLTWRDLAATLLTGLGNWMFDCGALVCGFLAVGAPVPWRGLLLAYGAGQLAANLPITPGGLGVVEGSLTVALVAFGGAELSTVAAVLCYRIVSFWGYLPVGWLVWAVVAWRDRRADRAAAAAAPSGHPPEAPEGASQPLSRVPAGTELARTRDDSLGATLGERQIEARAREATVE
ncbi:MAG: hypothetical protein JWM85_155 [Acidimicrobiaceae bacterium]|nr:hypothetical protein [Acidimicrobiaceae bacterium]